MSKTRITLGAAIGAGALTIAACGSSSAPKTTHVTAVAASSAPASSHPDCHAQLSAWAPAGAKHQQSLGTALGNTQSALNQLASDMQAGNSVSADGNTLAGDLGSLEGAVFVIKADMPPKCVPGLDADYGSAISDVESAGLYLTELLGAVNKSDTASAQADTALAEASLSQADSAFSSATTDLNTFNGSGSGT